MKRVYLLFLFLFSFAGLFATEVQWAGKLLGFSSQFSAKEHAAKQILGRPNTYPEYGRHACAWSPENESSWKEEWIMVGFLNPQKASQVMVVENNGAGSIKSIVLYDRDGNAHNINSDFSVVGYSKGPRVLRVKFPETSFKVVALKLVLGTYMDYGWNEIDAVGIVDSQDDLLIRPNLSDEFSIYNAKKSLVWVNTSGQEIMPVISPDGKKLYMDRKEHYDNLGSENQDDIWVSELGGDGEFGFPENIGPPLNTEGHNFMISLVDNGTYALLGNVYGENGKMSSGVSAAKLVNGVWQKPFEVKIEGFSNESSYSEYSLSLDKKVLVMAVERSETEGGRDLYVSFLTGDNSYGKPLHMGSVINSAESEMSPFISPNKRYLVFSSSGHCGFGGKDLFISKRLDETWQNWSEPINLGPGVNSGEWDAYFSMAPGSSEAFFCSVDGSDGGSDIFRIKLPESLVNALK